MDWSGCELVEVIPGKVSGVPLVKRTRIPADLVLDLFDSGCPIEEMLEDYPSLTPKIIGDMVAFAHARQVQQVP
jgi:uncharacterized protein (DUF433 family)